MSKNVNKMGLVINRIRPNMVKNDDMMSIEDVISILGIPLIGVIPDTEKIIIASNRGEPIVLDDKVCLPRIAFENTTRRLIGEEIVFNELDSSFSKNPIRRMINTFFICFEQKSINTLIPIFNIFKLRHSF
jgi:septum site-determining protein MinD